VILGETVNLSGCIDIATHAKAEEFTWHDASVKGWAFKCVERNDSVFAPQKSAGHFSGRDGSVLPTPAVPSPGPAPSPGPPPSPGPNPPPGHLPVFSWDTLPVFTHLSQQTPYTPEQMAVLGRFNLITIEKYMGPFPLSVGKAEEDNIAAVAAAIKKLNAKAKVLMYVNSLFAYPWYRLYHLANANNWWVLNETTHEVIRHNVINLNCSTPGHCPEQSVGYWDFAEPKLQEAWVAACSDPSIDGCFVDGAESSPYPYGKEDAAILAYEKGRNATFAAIAEKALVVVNDKKYYDPAPPYPQVQGEFLETFDGSALKWAQILNRTQAGHLVQAHTSRICRQPNSTQGLMDLAAFLIVAGPYSYFGCSDWEDVPTWPAVYDKPLGAPLGPAVQDATGTWKRAFVSGTSCSINFGTKHASIDWGGD
jgi:hypothetical protein